MLEEPSLSEALTTFLALEQVSHPRGEILIEFCAPPARLT